MFLKEELQARSEAAAQPDAAMTSEMLQAFGRLTRWQRAWKPHPVDVRRPDRLDRNGIEPRGKKLEIN